MARGPVIDIPSRPNITIPNFPKVKMHLVSFTGANGSVTYTAARSSGGTNIVYISEGRYTVTVPAGGTGAIMLGAHVLYQAAGTADVAVPRSLVVDNDTNFNLTTTGLFEVTSFDFAATPALNDFIGDYTVAVYVLEDPNVTNS